jgi:apolipoprotein N-acyltransferase
MTKTFSMVLSFPRVLAFVLALLSSGLLSLVLRPIGLGALALIALIPLLFALYYETQVWRGGLYTYVVAVGGVWVAIEGLAIEYPWVFVIGVFGYALAFAAVGIIVVWFKRFWGSQAILFFPIIWVALEFLISQPLLLGSWANPIMAIGYTQFDTPLLQAARWSSVTGTSFLVLAFNTSLAFALLEFRSFKSWLPFALVLMLSSLAVFMPSASGKPVGQPFRVGIAQAYLPTLEYAVADFDVATQALIIERYKILMESLIKKGAQLIVLPETAFGGWYSDPEQNQMLQDALRGVSLALVGVKTEYQTESGREGRNAILEFQREANRLREVYAKQIPIPLTEAGFAKGKNIGLVRMGGVIFGLGICWENTFPGLARASVLGGAQVLVYQNSLLWAGATATPILHQRISAFRAVETNRMVIHATGGGSSAIISADGQLLEVAGQTLEATLIGLVQARTGSTLFVQFGDWFGILCVVIVVGLFLLKLKPTARGSVVLD